MWTSHVCILPRKLTTFRGRVANRMREMSLPHYLSLWGLEDCMQLWALNKNLLEQIQRRGHKDDQRPSLLWRQAKRVGVSSLEKRRLQGDLIPHCSFHYLKGAYEKRGRGTSYTDRQWQERGNYFQLKDSMFRLDVRGKFFTQSWWGTGTGWLEKLGMPSSWKCSVPGCKGPQATWSIKWHPYQWHGGVEINLFYDSYYSMKWIFNINHLIFFSKLMAPDGLRSAPELEEFFWASGMTLSIKIEIWHFTTFFTQQLPWETRPTVLLSGNGCTVFVETANGKLEKWNSELKLDQSNNLLRKFANILPAVLRGEMGAEMNGSGHCLSWHCHQIKVGPARSYPHTFCLRPLRGLQKNSVDHCALCQRKKASAPRLNDYLNPYISLLTKFHRKSVTEMVTKPRILCH